MEPNNSNTKKEKYTHLKESERYKIEVLLQEKKKPDKIAKILGRGRATIYREIRRGSLMRLQHDLTEKKQYRADVAQKHYKTSMNSRQGELKIGDDRKLEEYIRTKIIKDKHSPDAIIGEIKAKGLKFERMICTKTLYNYIAAGIFSGISNENLWDKRKRRKRGYRTVSRVSRTNRIARSIELRPQEANDRIKYGHWEGDCVKGPTGKTSGLFTLTERKSLEEIIIKIDHCTQEEIQSAVDKLEVKYGIHFGMKFKSITLDNGPEFLNWKSLELSTLKPNKKRTTIYFAHAYSAWERGSNEVQNKMIRRFIPKGTDIHDVSEKEVQNIQDWMNNYPRKKLGYKSANEVIKKCFQVNND